MFAQPLIIYQDNEFEFKAFTQLQSLKLVIVSKNSDAPFHYFIELKDKVLPIQLKQIFKNTKHILTFLKYQSHLYNILPYQGKLVIYSRSSDNTTTLQLKKKDFQKQEYQNQNQQKQVYALDELNQEIILPLQEKNNINNSQPINLQQQLKIFQSYEPKSTQNYLKQIKRKLQKLQKYVQIKQQNRLTKDQAIQQMYKQAKFIMKKALIAINQQTNFGIQQDKLKQIIKNIQQDILETINKQTNTNNQQIKTQIKTIQQYVKKLIDKNSEDKKFLEESLAHQRNQRLRSERIFSQKLNLIEQYIKLQSIQNKGRKRVRKDKEAEEIQRRKQKQIARVTLQRKNSQLLENNSNLIDPKSANKIYYINALNTIVYIGDDGLCTQVFLNLVILPNCITSIDFVIQNTKNKYIKFGVASKQQLASAKYRSCFDKNQNTCIYYKAASGDIHDGRAFIKPGFALNVGDKITMQIDPANFLIRWIINDSNKIQYQAKKIKIEGDNLSYFIEMSNQGDKIFLNNYSSKQLPQKDL